MSFWRFSLNKRFDLRLELTGRPASLIFVLGYRGGLGTTGPILTRMPSRTGATDVRNSDLTGFRSVIKFVSRSCRLEREEWWRLRLVTWRRFEERIDGCITWCWRRPSLSSFAWCEDDGKPIDDDVPGSGRFNHHHCHRVDDRGRRQENHCFQRAPDELLLGLRVEHG